MPTRDSTFVSNNQLTVVQIEVPDRDQTWVENGQLTVVTGSAPAVGEWVAGTNTTLSIAGGRARATAVGANNPRISREVTGLNPGATYRVVSNVYQGTASGDQFFRVSDTQDLTLGTYMDVGIATGGAVDDNFVAPVGGTVYIGLVAICDADGQYAETDEDFTLTAL